MRNLAMKEQGFLERSSKPEDTKKKIIKENTSLKQAWKI